MLLSAQAVIRCLIIVLLALGAVRLGAAQQPAPAEPQVERIKSNEVLLDVLFRDKKGRMVRDVRPEEIEVHEDGVKQQVSSFRLIGPGAEAATRTTTTTAAPGAMGSSLSLATIVLDRFDPGRVQRARETALAFVDNALGEGVYARVCVIGRRLYLVEQFTNDRARLRKAIDRAIAPSEKGLAENSDRLVKQLAAIASGDASAATAATGADVPVTIAGSGAATEVTLARLTVETLSGSDRSMQDARSTAPIFPLLHLGRAQRRLPGRKLVVYFSNGLYLNPGLTDVLNTAISEANRANVTFYALDARILLASIGVASSRLESETVINATRRPETASYSDRYADSFSSNRVTSNFNVFDVSRRRAELGKQTALSELAEMTGGSMITAVNDINGMLRRATAELGNYHLISYSSTNQEFDGKFRKVEVKINRPGVTAQTRNGYFAVPPTAKRPSLAYETPLLAALNSGVVPRDFVLRASALRFESREKAPQVRESHHAVLLEANLADFIGAEDTAKKSYPVDLALLALIKDEKGEIIQSFSEHHPIEIPSAQLEDARKMNVTLTRDFWLPPGRYTLEVAAHNRLNERLSAERRVFHVVPPAAGLQLGSLYLIRQIEQVKERPADEADNPLFAGLTKLLPETGGELSLDGRAEITFHLSVFPHTGPDAGRLPAPTLRIELLHEGRVVASTTPTLPKADPTGRITFTAAIPTKGLVAGRYELRAFGKQGGTEATESLAFKLTGGPVAAATATDDGKVIESRLAAADRFRELAIVAINAAKPVEIVVDDLLRDTAANGARMFRRLGEYTYSLRKVRRTLDRRGRIRSEDYNDYEAYPVRGLHALVHLTANGSRLSVDRIGVDRRHATEVLIDDEARKQAEEKPLSFWGARVGGQLPGNKYASILIDPEIFFSACEFSSPRAVTLDGRETLVLDFRARDEVKLDPEKEWVRGLRGSIWIDAAEKALVRLEAQNTTEIPEGQPQPVPNFVYQQQRLADGLWSPQLIRINAAGDEKLFRGLNWDAWFEFSAFQKFDSRDSDVKLNAPADKKP